MGDSSICFGILKDCANPYYSYGEICVGCGCCSGDKAIRYPARLKLFTELQTENINFNYWLKGSIRLQKRNQKSNTKYNNRRIARYKYLVNTLESQRQNDNTRKVGSSDR